MILDAFDKVIEYLRADLVLILWPFFVRGCAVPLREDPAGRILDALPEAAPLGGLFVPTLIVRGLQLRKEALVTQLSERLGGLA